MVMSSPKRSFSVPMVVAGVPMSTSSTAPLTDRHGGDTREFQLNVDGQQVSVRIGGVMQPLPHEIDFERARLAMLRTLQQLQAESRRGV